MEIPDLDRDKRKRTEEGASPLSTSLTTTATGSKTHDEVFVVEGSPSPDKDRKPKKKKKIEPFSTNIACTPRIGDIEESANGLAQLMAKLEYAASDLTFHVGKNVNTKVEIKKLSKEIDMMSQTLSRKLSKYLKAVASKTRKVSGETSPGTSLTRATADAASQTDPPRRKPLRREADEKTVTEATTDEAIMEASKVRWEEEWFQATTIRIGNPWNSQGGEDFAILLHGCDGGMETGIARLLRDRFPDVSRINGTGSMKATSTVQVGTEDPVSLSRRIIKVDLEGTTETDFLAALKTLKGLASEGCGTVAIPTPSAINVDVFRKLTELVFRKDQTKAVISVPQGKGGKTRLPPTIQRPPLGESRRERRERETDVLIIKQGERRYSEMVRGLRAMVGASNGGSSIKEVRKTQDGRLLVAFQKGVPEREAVKNLIKGNWEGAEVSEGGRRASRKWTIHVKGLDDGVEDGEVKEAICGIVPGLERDAVEIGPRRPMYGGNFAVTVRVAGQDLQQLEGKRKIRIGFNTCTVEQRVEVGKCFRCWGFGHLAKNCKGPDRRSRCSGCGEEGHMVADCRNGAHCLLCDVAGHRAGSGRCPMFIEALERERAAARQTTADPPPHDD